MYALAPYDVISIYMFGADGAQGYNFASFESRVLAICEEHRQARRASAFAFILHDSTHPEVSRVLQDRHYWTSLNAIAGRDLTVFAIHAYHLSEIPKTDNVEYARGVSELDRGTRHVLEKVFGIDAVRLPALLFFQVEEASVLGSRLVAVRARTANEAYRELAELIRLAAEAVRDTAGRPIRNADRAFERIEQALRERAMVSMAKAAVERIPAVRDFLALMFRR